MAGAKRIRYQYGCLPFKVVLGKQPLILLITSRETGRWIVPKGRPERNRKAWQVAAQEAYEEAGVLGRVSTKSVGAYPSIKRLRSGATVPCTVRLFLMEVDQELDDWPERSQRQRRWVSAIEAEQLVSEPNLAKLLTEFAALWS